MNSTVNGASPVVGVPVNAAVGGTGTCAAVMYPVFVVPEDPTEFVAVRVTV